ncbi:MAG: hypothetical protein ACK5L3_03100 [Oscillospiraceae bacterium]
MGILIVILLLYLDYSNFTAVIAVPFADWRIEQWLLLVLSILMVITAGWRAYLVYRERKNKGKNEGEGGSAGALAQEEAEEPEAQEAEAQEPEEPEVRELEEHPQNREQQAEEKDQ